MLYWTLWLKACSEGGGLLCKKISDIQGNLRSHFHASKSSVCMSTIMVHQDENFI